MNEASRVALPENIRLGWKWLRVTHALAYYTESIKAIRKYMIYSPEAVFVTFLRILQMYPNKLEILEVPFTLIYNV
jgi:hypothetical protein